MAYQGLLLNRHAQFNAVTYDLVVTDDAGILPSYRQFVSIAPADDTLATRNALIAAAVAAAPIFLAGNEIANNIANALLQFGPTNIYSTQAQNIAALRVFWANIVGWDAVRMGAFLASLNLSDVSLENVFGVSAGAQLTALKARLASCASTYATGIVTVGQ